MELERDGWEQVGMLCCQGAQNIGLSNHKLKSALICTVWSQCPPVSYGQTDEHHGNSARIRSNEVSGIRVYQYILIYPIMTTTQLPHADSPDCAQKISRQVCHSQVFQQPSMKNQELHSLRGCYQTVFSICTAIETLTLKDANRRTLRVFEVSVLRKILGLTGIDTTSLTS